jgi:hypothetical protein
MGYSQDQVQALVANPTSLSQLQAEIEAGKLQYAATADASYQVSSANQYQSVQVPRGNTIERNTLRQKIATNQALIDKVVGSIHEYVTNINLELRFGSAVESAFENVRKSVDGNITSLIPNAMPILTTALENAQTDNQVQWNNSAKACRDLIKAAADALRPVGQVVTVSFWILTDSNWNGTGSNSKIRFSSPDGSLLSACSFNGVKTTWTFFTCSRTLNSANTTINATIGNDGTVGNIWFDDISLSLQ